MISISEAIVSNFVSHEKTPALLHEQESDALSLFGAILETAVKINLTTVVWFRQIVNQRSLITNLTKFWKTITECKLTHTYTPLELRINTHPWTNAVPVWIMPFLWKNNAFQVNHTFDLLITSRCLSKHNKFLKTSCRCGLFFSMLGIAIVLVKITNCYLLNGTFWLDAELKLNEGDATTNCPEGSNSFHFPSDWRQVSPRRTQTGVLLSMN